MVKDGWMVAARACLPFSPLVIALTSVTKPLAACDGCVFFFDEGVLIIHACDPGHGFLFEECVERASVEPNGGRTLNVLVVYEPYALRWSTDRSPNHYPSGTLGSARVFGRRNFNRPPKVELGEWTVEGA